MYFFRRCANLNIRIIGKSFGAQTLWQKSRSFFAGGKHNEKTECTYMEIQKSSEDYLETMLMMQKKHGFIRSIDVAEH